MNTEKLELIKSSVRTIPDFPKEGILFRDITTSLQQPESFKAIISLFEEKLKDVEFDAIAGIESRGFVFASVLSYLFDKKLILIRKKGKLPCEVIRQEYQLEYGTDELEIDPTSVGDNEKVILVDDLLATAGTILAAQKLVHRCGGKTPLGLFVIDLPELGGAKRLEENKLPFISLINFEGH